LVDTGQTKVTQLMVDGGLHRHGLVLNIPPLSQRLVGLIQRGMLVSFGGKGTDQRQASLERVSPLGGVVDPLHVANGRPSVGQGLGVSAFLPHHPIKVDLLGGGVAHLVDEGLVALNQGLDRGLAVLGADGCKRRQAVGEQWIGCGGAHGQSLSFGGLLRIDGADAFNQTR
jgi:hypothetical protein